MKEKVPRRKKKACGKQKSLTEEQKASRQKKKKERLTPKGIVLLRKNISHSKKRKKLKASLINKTICKILHLLQENSS